MALLEKVYCLSGEPTYTFVEPVRYQDIKVSVRTTGRCLVLEGPSGIGKTTTVTKVLAALSAQGAIESGITNLSARKPADVEYIDLLPTMGDVGFVIIDDFHRLPDETKAKLSDYMKVLADTGSEASKLILVGINKAGQQLVKFAHDLGLRIDVFRLEANSDEKIRQMIILGEAALNILISEKEAVIKRSQGSFQIAQLLCHRLCTASGISETMPNLTVIDLSLDVVIEEVMIELGRLYQEVVLAFARGSKLRREGRAPYLHILRWLADSQEWSLDLRETLKANPEHRGSIGQVLDKGFLVALLNDEEKKLLFEAYFHFEMSTNILSVEDPKLVFYLKNLVWREFTRQVGFSPSLFKGRYDFALSFAGTNREAAKRLFEVLTEQEVVVFYDEEEQHRIIAANIEAYLGPIYRRDADYVVAFLSREYPTRIWTKFESDAFRARFGTNSIIPIRYCDVQPGWFSDEAEYGGLAFDPAGEIELQIQHIAEVLCRRLVVDRSEDSHKVIEELVAEETATLP